MNTTKSSDPFPIHLKLKEYETDPSRLKPCGKPERKEINCWEDVILLATDGSYHEFKAEIRKAINYRVKTRDPQVDLSNWPYTAKKVGDASGHVHMMWDGKWIATGSHNWDAVRIVLSQHRFTVVHAWFQVEQKPAVVEVVQEAAEQEQKFVALEVDKAEEGQEEPALKPALRVVETSCEGEKHDVAQDSPPPYRSTENERKASGLHGLISRLFGCRKKRQVSEKATAR